MKTSTASWLIFIILIVLTGACQTHIRVHRVPSIPGPVSATEHIVEIMELITVGKMAGYVIVNDGYPLPGTDVELLAENKFDVLDIVKTDKDGRFRFKSVLDGDYWIRISKEGFSTVVYSIRKISSSRKGMVLVTDVAM